MACFSQAWTITSPVASSISAARTSPRSRRSMTWCDDGRGVGVGRRQLRPALPELGDLRLEVGHRASLPGADRGGAGRAMMAPMPRPPRATVALALALALAAMGAACGDSSRSATATTAASRHADPSRSARPTPTAAPPPPPATARRPVRASGRPCCGATIVDDRVTESSGVVASRRHPGRLWTHNDSDNPPVVFCVEPDGGSCGGWTVDGAGNVDWEDIAAGPGPQPGEHYLYVGDIGDNTRSRDDVVVYRVVEPTVPTGPGPGGHDRPRHRPPVPVRRRSPRRREPDGAPHHRRRLRGGQAVRRHRRLPGPAPGRRPDPDRHAPVWARSRLVTGADISPDGRRVALCSPGGGFELTLEPGASDADFDAIWASAAGARHPPRPGPGGGHRLPPRRRRPAGDQRGVPVAPVRGPPASDRARPAGYEVSASSRRVLTDSATR